MLRSSSRSSFARSDVDIPAPLARSAEHGPPMPTSAVTGAVRATNPILDEILHSLALIRDNDPSMTTFDIKDCTCFTLEHAVALGEALKDNTFLKTLIMHNARLLTQSAIEIAKGLAINESVESADLSGNSIGPAGMRALAEMLETNRGLIELRLDHQKSITPTGTDAEQTFARSLAKNTTLQKLSLSIRDVASRNQIDRSIARNKDAARKLLAKQKSMLSVA
nr:Leiomodin-1 [Polyrhizophydium stewartii]